MTDQAVVGPQDLSSSEGLDEERPGGKDGEFGSNEIRILQQLLANEWACLTVSELAFRNDDLTRKEVGDILSSLSDRQEPLVEKLDTKDGDKRNSVEFYTVTQEGISLLKDIGAYSGITLLYQMYENMEESPNRDYNDRPTPHWL